MARTSPIVVLALATAFPIVCNSVFASDTAPAQRTDKSEVATATPAQRMLKGIDADGDGIRDDLASLMTASNAASKGTAASKIGAELDAALANSGPPKIDKPLRSCLDYLLLAPADQAATNRYLQSQTSGTFGTHPCDPVTSPLLERPFENSVAVVPLGPVNLRYAKHD